MTNKDLIKRAVEKAHKSDSIIETHDFISGAWYMLESLKENNLLDFKSLNLRSVEQQLESGAEKKNLINLNERELK